MKYEKNFDEFVAGFPITAVGMIVLVREAIWAHPDDARLVRKLNLISFGWTRPYTKDELMKQVANLLREWANQHNCRIKDISEAAHQRYWIQNDGWIVRRDNWRPYEGFEAKTESDSTCDMWEVLWDSTKRRATEHEANRK